MRLFTLNYSDQRREVFWNLVSQFVRLSFIKSLLEHELVTYKAKQCSKPPDSDKKGSRESMFHLCVRQNFFFCWGKAVTLTRAQQLGLKMWRIPLDHIIKH